MSDKLDEIARTEGYDSYDQALDAQLFASKWLQKNPGRQPPIHIMRAVKFQAAIQAETDSAKDQMKMRLLESLRKSRRVFFGVVPEDVRFRKLRVRLRRALKLHLTFAEMVEHYRAIMPDIARGHYARLKDAKSRGNVLAAFAVTATMLYGLDDLGEDAPMAVVIAQRALEKKNA